jgi:hypothetical protein
MILISHRGNINGPNLELENTPDYIDAAIRKSFICEVDVWKIENNFFLSHDYPQDKEPVDFYFFENRKKKLIIHCKNMEALCYFANDLIREIRLYDGIDFHYFWHESDAYTLTSKGWIWAYPGESVISGPTSICVMPEKTNQVVANFSGICSDYIGKWID